MKNKNIFQSFKNAFLGLYYIYLTHKHFKIEILIGILTIIYFTFLKISYLEFLIVILTIFFVLFSEILNTAIEEICNLISQQYHEKIRIIKDMSGALVLLSVILSLLLFIFLNLKYLFRIL
jgi:diacylglycerol kinase